MEKPGVAEHEQKARKPNPFMIFREYGAREAVLIWKTGLDNIPDEHSKPLGFTEAAAFQGYADDRAEESSEFFQRGRYKRSEARKKDNIDSWRSKPDISNPGPDLANFPNSAFTLPQGRAYIEVQPFGYSGSFVNQPQQFSTAYLIRYGATDDIELRLFGNGITWTGGNTNSLNFAPIAFDVKVQGWLEKEEYFIPAMGIEVYLQTQWLGSSATNNGTQPGISFNFDQSLPWDVDLEYNFAAVRTQDSLHQNTWEFAFQWAAQRDFFSKDFALFVHGYYNAANLPRLNNVSYAHTPSTSGSGQNDCAVGAGFLWTVNSRIAVWGQASGGINTSTSPLISYAGFAVAF